MTYDSRYAPKPLLMCLHGFIFSIAIIVSLHHKLSARNLFVSAPPIFTLPHTYTLETLMASLTHRLHGHCRKSDSKMCKHIAHNTRHAVPSPSARASGAADSDAQRRALQSEQPDQQSQFRKKHGLFTHILTLLSSRR